MTDIPISPESVEAARKYMKLPLISDVWIEEMLRAALGAWPGMIEAHHPRDNQHAIILPLQEPRT